MKVYYVKDTRAGHVWLCQHGDKRYVVSYSFQDARWTVRPFRDYDENAAVDAVEAAHVLIELSKQKAARLLRWSSNRPTDSVR